MSQMLKSSGLMAAATLSSRVLGMVREIVYARFMGDGPVAGAFQLAFMIPNLFRRLLGEGALTAAFIPIFKDKETNAGSDEMWRAANAVISGLIVAAGIVCVLGMVAVTFGLQWSGWEAETHLMLRLLRWMTPYLPLVCLAATFMAMLNARGYFFIPALGAAMLNLVMIASVLWLAPRLGVTLETQIFGLAWGVLIAGFVQAGFQLPALRREGFRFNWISPWRDPTVREVVRKMIPGTFGVAAFQLNVLLTQGIAFWEDPQILASFNYAVRLMELPQGVFGISLATYLLPTLSGLAAEKRYPDFMTTLKQGLGHLVFVNAAAAAALCALAEPIVRLLFERGEFGPGATHRAAIALACLAPGLIAFSAVNVLARAFYALGDTQTPMKISVVCLTLNVVFTLWLVFPLRQGGLGVANTLSAIVNVGLLLYALRRKLPRLDFSELRTRLLTLLPAAASAGLIAWGVWHGCESLWGHATLPRRLGCTFVPLGVLGVSYLALTAWLKDPSCREMLQVLRSQTRR